MAKLYFRYGAMNSGKSTMLLQAAYNYSERDQVALIVKPVVDTKAGESVSSRIGLEKPVDVLLGAGQDLREAIEAVKPLAEVDAVFIDEAQFLEPAQVDQAFTLAVTTRVPVLAYGLRSDFRSRAFPGSARLMELAHSIEELKTICRCGSKALLNARRIDGEFVAHGAQVAIDGQHAGYESLCGRCYLDKVGPIRYDA